MPDPSLWLALGGAALLQLVAGLVRARGWLNTIRHSCPEAAGLRYRDIAVAHLGGCGWNSVLPARAGDAVKIAIVRRQLPRTPVATVGATLVAPSVVDAILTIALVIGLLCAGAISPAELTGQLPEASVVPVAAGLAGGALLAIYLLRHRLRRFAGHLRAGMSAVSRPGFMVTRILPWQAAARVLRLVALALVLVAAGLPFGIVPALALMALQGATPSMAPAATAVRVALIAGVFVGPGAGAVSAGEVATVLVGWYAVSSLTNLTASAAVTAWVLRTASPRRIFTYAREAFADVGREPGVAVQPAASRN
jgi:hypothetical protein